jgi:hypothetical protein
MFHFPTLPPPALCVQAGVMSNYAQQVSPFGNPRIKVWLPTPRGLSQAPTSFFGSWCQGIHRVPLVTWQLQMMLASTMQFSKYGRYRHLDRRVPRPHAHCTNPASASPRPSGEKPAQSSKGGHNAPVPSGPNSVPGPTAPATTVPPCTAGVLADDSRQSGRITSAPLVSSPPQDTHPGYGPGRDTTSARASCSLERR